MAARKNKIQLTDAWKEKIRVSVISGRLYSHLNGEIEMSPTQIKAAQILLSKLVPDLARTELVGDGGGPVVVAASPLDERL
jgi:hypothetical protein